MGDFVPCESESVGSGTACQGVSRDLVRPIEKFVSNVLDGVTAHDGWG